jgi:hypothetical protein
MYVVFHQLIIGHQVNQSHLNLCIAPIDMCVCVCVCVCVCAHVHVIGQMHSWKDALTASYPR